MISHDVLEVREKNIQEVVTLMPSLLQKCSFVALDTEFTGMASNNAVNGEPIILET